MFNFVMLDFYAWLTPFCYKGIWKAYLLQFTGLLYFL